MATLNQALAIELRQQGITRVFGLLGEDVVKLGVELERQGIECIWTRHEASAVGMGDGYARLSGELAVVLVSRGPGLTNALTALVNAAKTENPVAVLVTDSDPSARGTVYSKWVDQAAVLAAADVPFGTVESAASALADVRALLDVARSGRCVVVNLRGEILDAEAGDAPATVELPAARPAGGPPDPELIGAVADLLGETWMFKRPVVLAGRGATRAGARDELLRLAEACGAVVATTLMAKGLFGGDPYDIGIAGTYSSELATEVLSDADLVLAFGSSLDRFTTVHGTLFPKARFLRFDRDPGRAELGSVPVEVFVEADARLAATALADELERRGHREQGWRTAELAERIEAFDPTSGIVDRGGPGALDPRLVALRLDELLPRERTLVLDNGHHTAFATAHMSVPDATAFVSPLEFFCVGAATGMALAAPLARPDRLAYYGVGDCGLLMTSGELETIARYRLPILIVVMNDAALGAEVQYLRALGLPDDVAFTPSPPFAALAEALGIEAHTIETLADLDRVPELLDRLPVLLDVKLTADVRAEAVELVMLARSVQQA